MSFSARLARAYHHGGLTPEEERLIEQDARARDISMLKVISALGTVVLLLALVASFILPSIENNTTAYLIFALLFGVQVIAAFRCKPSTAGNVIVRLDLLSITTALAMGIFVGTITSQNYVAVTYIAMLLIVPSIYNLTPNYTFMLSFISVVAFCCLCYWVKPLNYFYADALDAALFLIVGTILGYFNMYLRFTGMVNTGKVALMSVTDALTGLKNRAAFSEALQGIRGCQPAGADDANSGLGAGDGAGSAAGAQPAQLNVSLISADVNGLKAVNDTLLHAAGDELLCGAAAVLREAFPQSEVYRLGGDEFAVISFEPDDVTVARVQTLRALAASWHGEKVSQLSLAVGMATGAEFPLADGEELLKEADMRMYQDKAAHYAETNHDRRQV